MKGHTMKRHFPLYLLAGALLVVGVVGFGLPIWTLYLVGFLVLCPLLMMFMMGGMHGDDSNVGTDSDEHDHTGHDHSGYDTSGAQRVDGQSGNDAPTGRGRPSWPNR